MMVAMLTYPLQKIKNKHFIKNFNKNKNYIHNCYIICIMKIVETWRLFFQFYFLQVRVQEVQLGEATQHEEKDTVITCIDVDCQYVRSL